MGKCYACNVDEDNKDPLPGKHCRPPCEHVIMKDKIRSVIKEMMEPPVDIIGAQYLNELETKLGLEEKENT